MANATGTLIKRDACSEFLGKWHCSVSAPAATRVKQVRALCSEESVCFPYGGSITAGKGSTSLRPDHKRDDPCIYRSIIGVAPLASHH